MKRWLLSLCVSAVALTAQQAFAGCSKDTDCKGDRICVAGACTTPNAQPAATPAPVTAPTPPPAAVTLTEPMIAEIYMKGDVTSAINEANAAKLTDLSARLTAISQAYGAAYAARQAGNTTEAIRQYELVIQYDRSVANRDNAYSSAAREALTQLYAQRAPQPAAPMQPQQYVAPPQYAAPQQNVPAVADRTVSFGGRSLQYTVDGQHCTAPCSLTLTSGAHVMEVQGQGRFRLNVVTDVTRVEARKGSPALAIISGVLLAATPFLFWAAANAKPDCHYVGSDYKCDDTGVAFAWVGASAVGLISLIMLPIGIVDAVRTTVTVNGEKAYRASNEVTFRPMFAVTGNGGYLGGQVSF